MNFWNPFKKKKKAKIEDKLSVLGLFPSLKPKKRRTVTLNFGIGEAVIVALVGYSTAMTVGGGIAAAAINVALAMVVSTALSMALSALTTKKPSSPSVTSNGRQFNTKSTDEPLHLIYGEAKVGMNWIYCEESFKKNRHLNIAGTWGEGVLEGYGKAIDIQADYTSSSTEPAGLNDLRIGGIYTGTSNIYVIRIDTIGCPEWKNEGYTIHLGDYVTSAEPNGFIYKCTTAGTKGSTEPSWPTTIGATVAEGPDTLVWTCKDPVIENIHDTFEWSKADNIGVPDATGVQIQADTWHTLGALGVKIKFHWQVGHIHNSNWRFFAGDGFWLGEKLADYYKAYKATPSSGAKNLVLFNTFHSGTAAQAVDTNLSSVRTDWNDALRNTAWQYLQLVWNDYAWNSIPEAKALIKGLKSYDPRTGTVIYHQNTALAALDFLKNGRYGLDVPIAEIDAGTVSSFSTAATWYENNGFTFNGAIVSRQEFTENFNDILVNGRAFVIPSEGKYKYKIFADDTAVMTVTDDDFSLEEGITINQPGIPETPTKVKCIFIDKNKNYSTNFAEYPDTSVIVDDEERLAEIVLIGTDNFLQAKRLAKYYYLRAKFGKTFSLLGRPRLFNLEPGDMITLTSEYLGFTAVKVRVFSIGLPSEGLVPLVLQEEDSSIYDLTVNTTEEEPAWISSAADKTADLPTGLTVVSTVLDESTAKKTDALAILQWDWIADGVDYILQYRKVGDSGWKEDVKHDDPGGTPTVITDTIKGLSSSVEYEWRVRSRQGKSLSEWAVGTNFVAYDPIPPTMTGVVLTPVSAMGGISLSWTPTTDRVIEVDKYCIYRALTDVYPGDANFYAIQPRTSNFFQDVNVVAGTKYYYWINIYNKSLKYAATPYGSVNATAASALEDRAWTQTCVFSVVDADTVAWATGQLILASGTTYSVGAGNTANMTARVFIYLDADVSATAYQTTTVAANAVGANRTLVATAINGTVEPTFEVFGGVGGINIPGNNIIPGTITANEIANQTITANQVANTTLTANQIANTTITANQIANTTITANQIANVTITANQIANATITTTQISNTAGITGNQIANATITANDIANATITGNNIANTTITANQIANATITANQISATAGITGGQIANATITANQIANTTITANQIANATITANQISGTAGITGGMIANATITANQIANGAITASQILDGSITANDIANATITATQIANNTITANEIANATITAIQISGTAGITGGQIANATITSNQIANGSITANHIVDGTITANDIGNAVITANQIANTTITANQIANGTVTATQIGNATITANQIANGTVTAAKIANATITANQIANATITAAQIGNTTITANQIANATITATQIGNSTITGNNIANTTIIATNIGLGEITTSQISNTAGITGVQIANTTITGNNLVNNTITIGKASIPTHFISGTFTNNSPIAGSVAWSNIKVDYNGTTYSITDGNTASKYIWWDFSLSTTTFQTAASLPTLANEDVLVATNTSGINRLVWKAYDVNGDQIQIAAITGSLIANTTITGNNIANSTITATQIGNAVITGALIANTTIGANNLILNTITANQIANATITTTQISNTAGITGNQIGNATIIADNLGNGSVTANKIGNLAVTTDKLDNLSITAAKIANATITTTQISGTAGITGTQIANATITTTQISGTAGITGSQIANATITSTQISGTAGITAGQIANATITTTQISGTAGITGSQIANATITANQIANLTITANQIANATVTATQIGNYVITANQIANQTIIATNIGNGVITTTQISNTAGITGTQIANTTITGGKLVNQTINANQIGLGVITGSLIANTTIVGTNIANSTITATQIGNATITGALIANTTISGNNLILNTITANQIANATITTTQISATAGIIAGQIANATITANQIATGAITSTLIANGTIEAVDIANATITANQIANATITTTQISGTAGITGSQIANATITTTQISGTAGITGAQIANATITTTQISGTAGITGGQIANGAITANQIANGTITAAKIGALTITANEIANATITATQITTSTITANQIANQTIIATNIGLGQITTSQISNSAGITGTQIANATITGDNIANQTITANDIALAAITGSLIANTTITANNIANQTINANQIGNAVITGALIANTTIGANNLILNTITANQIANATITTTQISNTAGITGNQIANATIIGTNIANAAITANQLGNLAVTTAKIDNLSVTAAQIANATITANQIANATITTTQISGTAGITANQIANGTITANQIANLAITANQIANATITTTQISGTAGITGTQIANATITATQISGTAGITASQIANATITANQIANLTIIGNNIANATITAIKISSIDANTITAGTITGRTLQTADTGKRFVVTAANNEAEFYGDLGTGTPELAATIGIKVDGSDYIVGDFGRYGGAGTNPRIGIRGSSKTNYGVYARTSNGIALMARGLYGGYFINEGTPLGGPIILYPSDSASAPGHSAIIGTLWVTSAGKLYINVSGSTTWELVGYQEP